MTTSAERPEITSFANHVLFDWESAMQQFFECVEKKRETRGLTVAQARKALDVGYGDEIGDAWAEWNEVA